MVPREALRVNTFPKHPSLSVNEMYKLQIPVFQLTIRCIMMFISLMISFFLNASLYELGSVNDIEFGGCAPPVLQSSVLRALTGIACQVVSWRPLNRCLRGGQLIGSLSSGSQETGWDEKKTNHNEFVFEAAQFIELTMKIFFGKRGTLLSENFSESI